MLWQFDLLPPLQEGADIAGQTRALWPRPLLVKALDALTFMGAYDSPYGAIGPQGLPGTWTWEQGWTPWAVVAADDDIGVQGEQCSQLAAASGGTIVVDLEPYAGFFDDKDGDGAAELAAWQQVVQGHGLAYQLCIDHRRLPAFPPATLLQESSGVILQTYWTAMDRPWLDVLTEGLAAGQATGRPVTLLLPADADPADFAAAAAWCESQGASWGLYELAEATKQATSANLQRALGS